MPAGRNDFQFDHPGIEIIETLLGYQAHEVAGACSTLGGGNIPAGKVAAADIEHLALAYQLLHRLPGFLPGRATLNMVHLVQVDMICLETAQALFAGTADVISREPAIVWPLAHGTKHLRCKHNLLAATTLCQPAPDNLLRRTHAHAAAIAVGGIEEVNTQLQRPVHNREAVSLARLRT